MRRVVWASFLILVLVITCGCLQQEPAAPPPVNTAPTPAAVVTLPPAITTVAAAQKELNFTVERTYSTVNVTYNGGPDAADLSAIRIRIDNINSQDVERVIPNPVPGYPYIFTYRGVADPKTVNIVGIFSNGYEQTVLMYYM